MGKRGPSRESAKILKLRGSRVEAKRPGPSGRQAAKGKPSCPGWLSDDAKTEWKRMLAILNTGGRVSTADRSTLATYCEAYAEMHQAVVALEREGAVYSLPNGISAINPWAKVRDSATRRMRSALADLGLTLKDRPDDGPAELDPLEEFLADGEAARQQA